MTSAERRLRATLTRTCSIARQTAAVGTDADMALSNTAVVAVDQPCALHAIKVSADMTAAGSLERDLRKLFMLPDADLQRHDLVRGDDDVLWSVTDVPQVFDERQSSHHLEVTVERKAVQTGWPSS